jgi:hypothetical protein
MTFTWADLEALLADVKPMVTKVRGDNPIVPNSDVVKQWLESNDCQSYNLFPFDLTKTEHFTLSIKKGAAGADLVQDPKKHWAWIKAELEKRKAKFALGLYGEDRDVYDSDQFAAGLTDERRSIHLGLDFFLEAGTPVFAPLDGRVVSVVENTDPLDYGPTVVLAHKAGVDGPEFYTLFGHLSRKTFDLVKAGQRVKAGDTIACLGEMQVNGGWAPHLHFQIMTTLLVPEEEFKGNFNGACEPSLWPIWQEICLDPNLLIGLSPTSFVVSK